MGRHDDPVEVPDEVSPWWARPRSPIPWKYPHLILFPIAVALALIAGGLSEVLRMESWWRVALGTLALVAGLGAVMIAIYIRRPNRATRAARE